MAASAARTNCVFIAGPRPLAKGFSPPFQDTDMSSTAREGAS